MAQPKLKYTTETVISVDSNDFDKFINKFYGTKKYEIIQSEECFNYMSKVFIVKKEPVNDYSAKELQEFIETGEANYITYTL